MNLNEKYRPRTATEFITSKDESDLVENVKSYVKNEIPVLLTGPAGIGKTTLAYLVANELGYKVIESNASDERLKEHLEKLKIRLRMKTFSKVLYLLDEVDGLKNQKFLAEMLDEISCSIIMTANESFRLIPRLKNVGKHIVMHKPKVDKVIERIKQIAEKENLPVNCTKVVPDFRASINNTFGNASGFVSEPNNFEKVVETFREGKLTDVPIIWLIDNAHKFYKGFNLLKAIKILCLVDQTGNRNLFACLPPSTHGKPDYPYFLRKTGKNGKM